jgi:Ca-activated chloride channel family protein
MKMMSKFEFVNPEFLWLLLILPLVIYWFFSKRNQAQPSLKISSTTAFNGQQSIIARLKPWLSIFKILALTAIIIALARPRNIGVTTKTKKNKGIDIVMAVDVSASMLARDLKPNRLEALKRVAEQFINGRPNDRFGIVVYAGESYTQVPLTSDKTVVARMLRKLKYGQINQGTAIGMGLATAVNRLKDSKAKGKVIILLTDGVNNVGSIDPKTATELAKAFDIKVYTIGLGTNGKAQTPYSINPDGSFSYQYAEVTIDEDLLKNIAKETGGQYFRATDNNKLKAIYNEINKLEKTEIETFKYYNYDEKYRLFIWIALALLFIEFVLQRTLFKSFI